MSKNFYFFWTKTQGTKFKNWQMRLLYHTKDLQHRKGNNQQGDETIYRIGKIFSDYWSDTGVICRLYKELKKPQ